MKLLRFSDWVIYQGVVELLDAMDARSSLSVWTEFCVIHVEFRRLCKESPADAERLALKLVLQTDSGERIIAVRVKKLKWHSFLPVDRELRPDGGAQIYTVSQEASGYLYQPGRLVLIFDLGPE